MQDIIIRLIALPTTIRALTTLDNEDNYNIYINNKLSLEGQIKAYRHELQHIVNDDFNSNEKTSLIENRLSNFFKDIS